MSKLSKIIYLLIAVIVFCFFNIFLTEQILSSRFSFPDNKLLDIVFVQNTGAAFSIFENAQLFLIIFSFFAIFLITFYIFRNMEKWRMISIFWSAMLISGMACNLYERLAFGFVRDYFNLNFINFPVFNISDIFINISVFALIVIIVMNKYLTKNNETNN